MPDWPLFGTVAIVLTVGFVALARSSARTIRAALATRDGPDAHRPPPVAALESDRVLAGNVVATHGALLVLLAGTVWYSAVPLGALGLASITPETAALGVGLGLALAVGNEGAARAAERLGLVRDERLRALLAPDSTAGWVGLIVVVLPLVAAAEELLFRGVLIGGLAVGFGLHPWLLIAGASIAFGLGHALQGTAGIAVTAGLGVVLGAAFVLTGSLAVVVVAHYLVNAVEFVANEGIGG